MATRSVIGIIRPDNTIEAVYCHWDGYPSNNGVILRDHYKTVEGVEALIALGQISSLGVNVSVTEAYGRDRGETSATASRRWFKIDGDTVTPSGPNGFEEFAYFFDARPGDGFGRWLAASTDTGGKRETMISLAELIAKDDD